MDIEVALHPNGSNIHRMFYLRLDIEFHRFEYCFVLYLHLVYIKGRVLFDD